MNEKIKIILQDLYKLDPDLKQHEDKIIKIIGQMIEYKPDTQFDENFNKKLREELVSYVSTDYATYDIQSTSYNNFWNNIRFLLSGFALASMLFLVGFYIYTQNVSKPLDTQIAINTGENNINTGESQQITGRDNIALESTGESFPFVTSGNSFAINTGNLQSTGSVAQTGLVQGPSIAANTGNNNPKIITGSNKPSVRLSFGVEIKRSGTNAFGDLTALANSAQGMGGGGVVSSTSGVGGSESFSQNAPTTSEGTSADTAPSDTSAKMGIMGGTTTMYIPTTYKYIYNGEKLDLSQVNLEVLKKIKTIGGESQFIDVLKNFKIDSFNLSKLSSLKIDSINFLEDKEFGYNLSMNFSEGTLAIWRNFSKWPQLTYDRPEDYQRNRIKLDEIPSDEKSIEIANNFIKQYGIDISSYGSPYVDNNWKIQYNATENKKDYYFPESVSVVYPLVINGKNIYEEYGTKSGIRLMIDIRTQRVSDVSGIESLKYESSKYDIENDFNKLLDIAQKGGRYNVSAEEQLKNDPNTKIVEVQLGKPTVEYISIYEYKNNIQQKYYVPGLVFPIVGDNKDINQQNIVVPLVKDFYNN